ncbi:MAG: potassium channel family protein [Chlamydiota bacterium]
MEKLSISNRFRKGLSGQFSQLIVFLLLLFIFRPVEGGVTFHLIWQFCFAGVLFSAIFNCHHSRLVKILGVMTGAPALLCNWTAFFIPDVWIVILGHSFGMFFLIVCTCSILHMVIVRAKVTVETLRGAVCVYLMIGFFFTLLYTNIELLNSDAFFYSHRVNEMSSHSAYLSEMVYFSFVTLLSIGYGDVVPLAYYAQTLSILEGVIGHFYLAILVARLVAVYSFREEKHLFLKHFEKKGK